MTESHARGTRRRIIAVTSIVTVLGAGAAFAYWTASGSGTGSATTWTSIALTIAGGAQTGEIVPGGPGATVVFTVTNPSAGPQTIGTVTATAAGPGGTTWVPTGDCLAADYVVSVTAQPTPATIPAGGTATGTATITLTSTGVNQDDCQGQAVPLYFTTS